MDDFDIVVLLELLRDGARAGRAADDHLLQIGQLLAGLLEMLQQHQPDGRHRRGERHLLGIEHFVDRGAVHLAARHDQLRADHRAALGQTPGIGVEHRHDRQDDVLRRDAHRVRHAGDHRVQHVRAVAVEHALGIAGRAGRVAHAGRGVLVELLPGEIAVGLGQPLLVGHHIRQAVSGMCAASVSTMICFSDFTAGAIFSTSGRKVRSTNSALSSAWFMIQAICSGNSRGLSVW